MTEFSAAKLRELIEDGDQPLHRHSGHVSDPHLSKVLSSACGLVDGFEDSKVYEVATETAGTQQATRAAEEENDALLGYLGGLTDDSITASEVRGLMHLLDRVRRAGYLATFFGRTNNGKTNVALLGAEIALNDDPDMVLVTNITSVQQSDLPRDRYEIVESYPELRRTVEFLKSQGKRTICVLDEFSSHASGYGGDKGHVEDTMRKFVRKLAKTDSRAIIIGHDGQDVHPTMREFSDDIIWMRLVEETGIVSTDTTPDYRAEFYESVTDRQPVGHRFTLSRVPETGITYNPDEYTNWAWS